MLIVAGYGYAGGVTASLAASRGDDVIALARSAALAADAAVRGARHVQLDLDLPLDAAALLAHEVVRALPKPTAVLSLLPAAEGVDADARTARLVALSRGAPLVVVVSTGLFGATTQECTERTRPRPSTDREKRIAAFELAALKARAAGHDVRVVRVPAIYGPGRAFERDLRAGTAQAIRPAHPTSRIHVDDLAALLLRMLAPDAPPLLLACDDAPAPTWEVMREAARLLEVPPPRFVSPEEAPQVLSAIGLAMRQGRRCRSLVRPLLDTPLRYPTWREGLSASLRSATESPRAARH